MIYRYYSIFDNKAVVYMPPFHALTDAAAIRSVQDAMSDPQTSLHRHPGDFVLFFVGYYDDQRGRLQFEEPLVHVVDVAALASKPIHPSLSPEGFEPSGRPNTTPKGDL